MTVTGTAMTKPAIAMSPRPCKTKTCRLTPTVMKNDRWCKSLFGAPPPANPARDTSRRNRWKSQRFGRLVSHIEPAPALAERRTVETTGAAHLPDIAAAFIAPRPVNAAGRSAAFG